MIRWLAPMDGITNVAYRIVVKRIFDKYIKEHKDSGELRMWTEFMNAEGYVRQPQRLVHHLMKTSFENQTIAQIYGWDHEDLIATAKDIVVRYPWFAWLELNIGCPSPKVMSCGGGAGMMRDKWKTLELIKRLRDAVAPLPFSIKTRAGLVDDDKVAQKQFIVDAAEYCTTITIHGRTYKQWHSGSVDWEYLYDVKRLVGDKTKIIGNGGIKSYEDALAKKGNLDGVMIGQAAIADPRVFLGVRPSNEELLETILFHLKLMIIAYDYYNKNLHFADTFPQPSYEQRMDEVEHFDVSRYDIGKSVIEYRKYLFNYVNGLVGNREFKNVVATIREYEPLIQAIHTYFAWLEKLP